MGPYRNEIEQFIYEICYRQMWDATYTFIYQHPYQLDLSFARIKYPDSAMLEDMVLEFTRNIRIIDDHLLFDAVVSCTVNLSKDNYKCYYSYETSQWLVVSCEVTISHKLESLDITSIKSYSGRSVKRNL